MSFYKLEKASVEEATSIIEKLDIGDKKDYLLKAAKSDYIRNEIFAVLVDLFKDDKYMLGQAFSQIALEISKDGELNPKLKTLLATGVDLSHSASQSLINGAYMMNGKTASLLIENGANPCAQENSALKNAVYANNQSALKELMKHGNNQEVLNSLENTDLSLHARLAPSSVSSRI